MAITHAKVSAESDDPDTDLVRPSDWNAAHVIGAGTITDTEVAAANKDGTAGTASMRTLGTGAQQAAAGNHTHSGFPSASDIDPQILIPWWYTPRDAFSTISLGSTHCHAYYFGRAVQAFTTFDVLHRVATQITGTTWAEIAIAKSTKPTPAGNRSLTVVGYINAIATWTGTGNKTATIPVSGGQSIAAGDHLWIVAAKLSTSSPAFRACPVADELDTGTILEGGNVRPSVILGTPTTFNAGQTTRLPMLFAVYPS